MTPKVLGKLCCVIVVDGVTHAQKDEVDSSGE